MTQINTNIPTIEVRRIDGSAAAKRSFDVVFALLLLPIVAPLVGLLFIVARIDGGSGFFGHARMGRNGRTFRVWKIRTMVPDADARLEAHLRDDPAAKAEWQRNHKLRDDPRITSIGQFMRKTSLDELPQIVNVLRGEMSFVGPRPVPRDEFTKYDGYEWAYLSVKPGITGLWQVSGRNEVDYPTRVQMDVDYARNRSFVGDLAIIARTAQAVTKRTGC